MPTDNALLPATIHLSYLADDAIVAYLRRARESIRFVGPGLSSAAAKELKERWYDLGPGAVQVVVEADADLCRIGYGDADALRMIFEAGKELGETVHQQRGIRLCMLEIDGEQIIFPPTPRLVEEADSSAAEIILAPTREESLQEQILAPPQHAAQPLSAATVKNVITNLEQRPAQPFDLARQVRVLSTNFQFCGVQPPEGRTVSEAGAFAALSTWPRQQVAQGTRARESSTGGQER